MAVIFEEASSGILPELEGKWPNVRRVSRTYFFGITGPDLDRFEKRAANYPGGHAKLLADLIGEFIQPEAWEAPAPDLGHAIDCHASELNG